MEKLQEWLEERLEDMERRQIERIEAMEKRILAALSKQSGFAVSQPESFKPTTPTLQPIAPTNPTPVANQPATANRPSWMPPGVGTTSTNPTLPSMPALSSSSSSLDYPAPIEDSFRDEYMELSNRHWTERKRSIQENSIYPTSSPTPTQSTEKHKDVKEMNDLAFL